MQPTSARVLKTFDATAMVTGNMIGSGIFLLSGYAASSVSGGVTFLLAWIVGGLMALGGALATAELATRMPRTGGDFLYLHEVYGPFPAFLYGWMSLVISMSGSIAILALFSGEYFLSLFSTDLLGGLTVKGVAYTIVILFTLLHILRVTIGARFQSVLTVIKISCVLVLAFLLFSSSPAEIKTATMEGGFGQSLQGFSVALVPIFFTYSGWNVVAYMAGEVKEPRKTLPLALILGTGITIVLYVFLMGSFLHVLRIDGMRADPLVPITALGRSQFSEWTPFVIGLILISVVSSLSIAMQSGARIYQAMAEHGVFFHRASYLHKRFQTPVISLLIQGVWSIALILIFPIRQLVDSVTVVMVLFSALTISSLFKARRMARKDDKNLFKTPWFPLLPVAYILSCLFIAAGVTQYYLGQGSLLPSVGFGFALLGSLTYLLGRKRKGTPIE